MAENYDLSEAQERFLTSEYWRGIASETDPDDDDDGIA
jgi:hypothetical protein